MCGIAGSVCFDGSPVDGLELARLTDAMIHRGPDGRGCRIQGRAGFGNRRLAVIDLETGEEPIVNEDESVWLTFNGEIFNFRELRAELEASGHRFRSRTDAEVVVHGYEQWGERCVERLRGM